MPPNVLVHSHNFIALSMTAVYRSETIWQIKLGRLERPLRLSKLPIALQSDDRPKGAHNGQFKSLGSGHLFLIVLDSITAHMCYVLVARYCRIRALMTAYDPEPSFL